MAGAGDDIADLCEVFKKQCNHGVSATQTQKATITTANCTKWFKVTKPTRNSLLKRSFPNPLTDHYFTPKE